MQDPLGNCTLPHQAAKEEGAAHLSINLLPEGMKKFHETGFTAKINLGFDFGTFVAALANSGCDTAPAPILLWRACLEVIDKNNQQDLDGHSCRGQT